MKNLIFFLFVLVNGILFAENFNPTDGKNFIKGVVIDSTSASELPYANITLMKETDSSLITGVATGTKGEFSINNIPEGNYFLKISYVGYNSKLISNIRVNGNNFNYDLGQIKLVKSAYELEAAEVQGEKVGEEFHLDKKVINVANNSNVKGGTALDVLENQPSVRVDPDGTVYLRGSSSFKILVNGKPYPLQGSDALKQIPANSIESIELITNPSSAYDAEGTAGIININLKKVTEQSFSGILNLNGGNGDRYSSDFSGSYNINGLSLTGGVDFRKFVFNQNQYIERTTSLGSTTFNNTIGADIRSVNDQYSGRIGADYNINNSNSAGFTFGFGKVDVNRSLFARSIRYSNNKNYSLNKNFTKMPLDYINSSLTYNYKINPDVNDLAFELTYNYLNLPYSQSSEEYFTDETHKVYSEIINKDIADNFSKRNEGRGKINYKHKLSEVSNIETGVQTNYYYRQLEITNRVYDKNTDNYVLDNNLSNNFDMKNNIYSGFVSFSSEIEGIKFMVGLRGEYTDRFLKQLSLGQDFYYEKMDYFPSLNISKKIDDHQLQFSYSRRINRPNESLLNPFTFYSDANISIGGNPYLLPEYINSFELNYQKLFGGVFLSVQNYYRNSNNAIGQTFSVDNTGRVNIRFNNYGNTENIGSDISASFSPFTFLKLDPAVHFYNTKINGLENNIEYERNYFNWSSRLNATVTFSPEIRFMFSGSYMNFVSAQSESKPFMFLSASLRHEFFNKTMSLTLQARNLFKAADFEVTTKGSNFDVRALMMQESPILSLTFSYNFNNFKRTQRPTENIDIPTGF